MVMIRRSPQVNWMLWSGIAIIFLAGLGVGLLAARTMAATTPSIVSQEDYVALVAVLYDRERSLSSARDRLKAIGSDDDAKLVSSVSNAYSPGIEGQPNDAEALRQLSIALSRAATTPEAAPTSGAQSTPTRGGATIEPSSGVNWLLVIAIVVMASLLIALLFFVRWVVRPSSGRNLPSGEWSTFDTGTRRTNGGQQREAQQRDRPATARSSESSFSFPLFGTDRRSAGRESRTQAETAPGQAKRGTLDPDTLPVEARRSFVSRYRLGDDPFDEVHPILDPSSGLLIGACGLSAALQGKSAEGRGYYAFLVWVHDYLAPQSFKGIGLTTRWRIREKAEDLASWVQSAMVDEVAAAENGFRTTIETKHLWVEISLPEVESLPDEEGLPDGYFRSLAVRFDVSVLRTAPRTARDVGEPSEAVGVSQAQEQEPTDEG